MKKIIVASLGALMFMGVVLSLPKSADAAITCPPYVFTKDFQMNQTGTEVVAIQEFLMEKNILVIPANTSMGTFGTLTRDAVVEYQRRKGLLTIQNTVERSRSTRTAINAEMTTLCAAQPLTNASSTALKFDLYSTARIPDAGGVVSVDYFLRFSKPVNPRPTSVSLTVSCPSGVSAKLAGQGTEFCNQNSLSYGDQQFYSEDAKFIMYKRTLNFKNTSGQSRSVTGNIKAYTGANLVYSDVDTLNLGTTGIPSINILTPNGQEVYYTGETVSVRWKAINLPYNVPTQLSIMDDRTPGWQTRSFFGSSPALNDATLVSSTGNEQVYEYKFVVPQNFNTSLPAQYQNIFGGAHYKMYVNALYGGVGGTASQRIVEDMSDLSFTLNTAPALNASIRILSPNGDIYYPNNSYPIRWTASSSISALRFATYLAGTAKTGYFSQGIPASQGTTNFTTGPSPVIGNHILEIEGLDSNNNVIARATSSFSIQATPASTTAPRITVATPNGGTYKANDGVSIRWTSQNIPADKVVSIALINKKNNSMFVDSVTQGYCSLRGGCIPVSDGRLGGYTIPDSIAPGEYKLKVTCWDKNSEGTNCAASGDSSYFNVVASNQGYGFTRDLQLGSQGADVLRLKTFLRSNGFAGIWGSGDTTRAEDAFWQDDKVKLAAYQATIGITPDGIFAGATREYVNNLLNPANTIPRRPATTTPVVVTTTPQPVVTTDTALPTVRVLMPNAGATLTVGQTQQIRWEATGASTIDIRLYNSVVGTKDIITGLSNTGSYNWTVDTKGNTSGGVYAIGVRANNTRGSAYDVSDVNFAITPVIQSTQAAGTPPVMVARNPDVHGIPVEILAPHGNGYSGESLIVGQTYTIKWTAPGADRITLNLYRDGTSTRPLIASDLPNTGSYLWTISRKGLGIGGNYAIVATAWKNATATSTATSTKNGGLKFFQINDPYSLTSGSQTQAADSQGALKKVYNILFRNQQQ